MPPAPNDPGVTLTLTPLLMQGADLVARAAFAPAAGGPPLVPQDTQFRVLLPSGGERRYKYGDPSGPVRVDLQDGSAQLVFKTTEFGRHHVRVEGSLLAGQQRVRVAAEAACDVMASPFQT